MSYSLYTGADPKYIGDLATNKGLDDLEKFVETQNYDALKQFVDEGMYEDIPGLAADVAAAIKDGKCSASVADTLKGLLEMLKKAEDGIVTIIS